MNILWLNQFLLFLLPLALLPLALHLFARARPKPYKFSSNRFLSQVAQKNVRIKRPYDILLLVLRTLLFLMLLLLFCRPVICNFSGSGGMFKRKNIVLLVDASASMGYMTGGQTAYAAACAEASEILDSLNSDDRSNLIWIRLRPNAEFSTVGANTGYLRQALRREPVSSEKGNPAAAVKQAVEMLKEVTGNREICIISDFQKTQWQDCQLEVPEDIKLVTIKVGGSDGANTAISSVETTPSEPLPGEQCDINCRISNYSSEAVGTSVYMSAGEFNANRSVMLPPSGSGVNVFRHRFTSAGSRNMAFSLKEDAFPADNTFFKVIDVRPALRIGILEQEQYPAFFWKKAFEALDWANVEVVDMNIEPDRLRQYDVLMLSGWDGSMNDKILDFLKAGKAVVCAPGKGLKTSDLKILTGTDVGATPVYRENSSTGYRLRLEAAEDPVFELFSGSEYGDVADGVFFSRMHLNSDIAVAGTRLLMYRDGVPALVRYKTSGTFYLWNIELDHQYSSWASRTQFLPQLAELILKGARPPSRPVQQIYPGERLQLMPGRQVTFDGLSLTDINGKKYKLQCTYSGRGLRALSEPLMVPNIYIWRFRDSEIARGVVNFPLDESDLATLDDVEINKIGMKLVGGTELGMLNDGFELWPWLLAVAVLAALAEGIVMLRSNKVS